jgi:hypothetical protein
MVKSSWEGQWVVERHVRSEVSVEGWGLRVEMLVVKEGWVLVELLLEYLTSVQVLHAAEQVEVMVEQFITGWTAWVVMWIDSILAVPQG